MLGLQTDFKATKPHDFEEKKYLKPKLGPKEASDF